VVLADGALDGGLVDGERNLQGLAIERRRAPHLVVSDLERGLAEMVRVVRPGGRVVVLEITTPRRPPLSTFFEVWFDRVVPVLGRLAGDAAAYSYLPSSVRRFPGPDELAALMAHSGLREVRYLVTAGGIVALHVGVVREDAS
jgi:demethylmenaquinone methyltransferase/2-methoxy-6-polyprenyl-1,4-benzoquinol methylase